MKKLAFLILIISFLLGIYFSASLPKRLFAIHVLSPLPETIKNLKHYKDRCGMHGPFIFSFEADKQATQNIVKNNNLIKYEKIPDFAETLLIHLDIHNLSWWKKLDDLKSMGIYGKEDQGDNEPHLKFIFIDKETQVYYLQI